MKINITENTKDYLLKKDIDGKHIFLALDDGSSKFSKLGGSCAIGNKFQLVISSVPDQAYTDTIENDADLNLTTSKEEANYLGNGLKLDYKMGLLKLSDDSSILDGAVTVQNYEPTDAQTKDELAKDMKDIGNKIC
ncbi:iron-sulfur cluster biosynthesis family protein [Pediococcus pentosaceus]|uniref:iron-sulfur cluster biosynthesis family protein n=1 Tax=Pediococcus pentosaceus TaxID=1255 RepID=UPI001326DF64|nr:iron-sulfur cluster biosynthesis family protein [Pediococcus pentosaceus]KAF0395136.1 iron-sulfur cluster biosynthesis family protein [Pediococcus pentosaceus]KAF0435072.1 iron-sulfur cluster biosynthesis family protein [Pediococcus pentosaceus]KAF0443330.1 iron-sulfur cluster biosynthesis family protein [Pediococcus pentosaceus]MBF7107729.1 iron-sulfur cluster biosynthesis family protein [Pediococcus pentosaceus]